jgi:single-strand DNA-binding protein
MAGINRIQIIGRLGTDPEVRDLPSGGQLCVFRVAVDRQSRGSNDGAKTMTDWFNVEAWGRLGEICQEYLSKGRLVYLEGRLQTDRYEQGNNVKYFTKIVVSTMQMLDRPAADGPVEAEEIEEGLAESF